MKLISPDDRSELKKIGNNLIDSSDNEYKIINDKYYLLPQKEIRDKLEVTIKSHSDFRNFNYSRSLKPINDLKISTQNVKESNVSSFIPKLEPNESAYYLDHGCGSGSMRRFIESLGYTYIGADNESGLSTSIGGGEGFKGGATHYCDLHRLPFADGSFKFAHSYSVFEHLQNPFLGAKELFRVMESKGTCFIAIANLIPFHMDSFYHMTHFGVLNLFQSVGFKVDQVAGANWNGYEAISSLGGLPGPKWFRDLISGGMVRLHNGLWKLKAIKNKKKESESESTTRHNRMAGIMKVIIQKP